MFSSTSDEYRLTGNEDTYYAILNISKNASQQEINERYRSLSLIFHPDRHSTNTVSKEVATEQFLLLQKAYQVLSDPFLRRVYDVLGEEGLSSLSSDEMRTKSESEFNAILQNVRHKLETQRLESHIIPRGALNCTINATPLMDAIINPNPESSLSDIGLMSCNLKYSVKKRVHQSTVAGLTANLNQPFNRRALPMFYGTVQHQFSPRLSSSLRIFFIYPFMSTWGIKYSDGKTFVGVETSILPGLFPHRPNLGVVIGRKLSPHSPTQGILQIQMDKRPTFSFLLSWPSPNNDTDDEDENYRTSQPLSSLNLGTVSGSCGISFQSGRPALVAEIGVMFYSLATRMGSNFSLGLNGISLSIFGKWTSPTTEVSATTTVDHSGVIFHLELAYMKQRLSLPIILSAAYNPRASIIGIVVPSTVAILIHHFVLQPRNRAQRMQKLREAQQALQEDSEFRRKQNTAQAILKDVAKRQTQNEITVDGLIIQSASYGPRDLDSPEARELFVDVTAPIQAIVRKSQLYIASGDTKSSIPGFIDPAPSMSKILRIRYLFHGQPHYAEIPDYIPVILPLAEHRSYVMSIDK